MNPTITITTLGTSHGSHTATRFNSSTLFEVGNDLYLIDAGAPVEGLLIRAGKDISAIKAVFLTHMHNDHVGGLPGLIKQLIKEGRDGQHTDIYLPEECAGDGLEAWLKAQRLAWPTPLIDLHITREGSVYADDKLAVSAQPTRHLLQENGEPGSFCYVLTVDGKTIVYSGDLTADFSDFPWQAGALPCDLCITEATHYPIEKALPILADAPIRRLIFNHIGDNWHGGGEAELIEHISCLPYPCEIAEDGSTFYI
ncbi:MAG: ribonuclease Z [Lentisphaeria bacterium]|nr:MBL fold metallo-hydrolase [Lentisphaeria bacterium]NQZ68382.1 ribonuclease Z [Lentisphaeria bacterium]